MSETDVEKAVAAAWQCLADSCVEGDCEHEARALEELRRLGALPSQREPGLGS